MLSSLMRVASEAGSYAATSGDIGLTATNLPVRRISNAIGDGRSHPSMGITEQLNSFRGTVYAAVDKIARRVAQIPMRLTQHEYSRKEDKIIVTPVLFHPFVTLFSDCNGHAPHEEYSVWELIYTMMVSLDMAGECWWLVERDEFGVPSRITPLPANRMTIVFDKSTGRIAGYFYCPKGTTIEDGGIFIPKRKWDYLRSPKGLTEPFITFFRYPSPAGIEDPRGWSPVKAAAYAYDINLYEQIYKRNFLQNGAQLGGILQSEVALSADQIKEYLEQFKARHSGVAKAGLPMVLPKMLKWETTEPTPRDMQWAEALNMTQSQILQIYGISDAKLGRADIGNRNTADAMDVTFNREVIQSRLDIVGAKLHTDFMPVYPNQTDQLYFSAKFDDPVPGDGEMAMKREDQDMRNGVRTPNEIRASRNDKNLKPMGKYGDQIYRPLNALPVDPFADTLEVSQDDADLLGFITPDDQAKIDADAAEQAAKLAPKEPGDTKNNADAKKQGKEPKKGSKSFGRSLHGDSDPALDAIVAYLLSHKAVEMWYSHIYGIVEMSIRDEVEIAMSLVGEVDIDPEMIAAAWARQLVDRLVGINEFTAENIRLAVTEGLSQEETLRQIVQRIEGVFGFGKLVRAERIARTEILGAVNYSALAVYKAAGILFKRWLTNMDGLERGSHAECNRQLVHINEKFIVGGAEMEYPGDPTAPAREVINCRCGITPETDEERSLFDDVRLKAIWDAFAARAITGETLFADAARLVFEQQRAHVISILNQFVK